jgi:hypothetical protein
VIYTQLMLLLVFQEGHRSKVIPELQLFKVGTSRSHRGYLPQKYVSIGNDPYQLLVLLSSQTIYDMLRCPIVDKETMCLPQHRSGRAHT